ncbi:MAG TPA: FkbM family methyltransferase [Chlamydiales bacterium]|nr:FkbM family methyltransferase [Chlamydiales bacterium]
MRLTFWNTQFLFFLGMAQFSFAFEGFQGRPLETLSLFLPEHPGIYGQNLYPQELEEIKRRWPGALFDPGDRIDLIRCRLEEAATIPSDLWDGAKAVYLDAFLCFEGESLPFAHFLEQKGYCLLSQWNKEGALYSFIFVKREFLSKGSLEKLNPDLYGLYDLIVFYPSYGPVRYYLDDDEEDTIKTILKNGYAYEGNLSIMLHALAKEGSLVVDIGAHIGVHTIFLSRKVGPRGAVISFEPNQKLYKEHLANLELNHCKNVIAICKGLGAKQGQAFQHRIEIQQTGHIEKECEEIEIVPLDSYCLNSISLIKMDIENYEYPAFLGMKETILRNRPVILFESWINYEPEKRDQKLQRENFERVMELLESYGYEIYVIYNCDFLAIPVGNSDPLVQKYKRSLQRLDPKRYQLQV